MEALYNYGGFWDMEYATKINGKQYICRENNWDISKRQNEWGK